MRATLRVTLLALGVAAAVAHLRRADRLDERLVASGAFWRAVDVTGDTLLLKEGGGLTLLPGQALIVEASDRRRLSSLSVAMQPLGSQAVLQLEWDDWLLTVTPGETAKVQLEQAATAAAAGAKPVSLAAEGPASITAPLIVELRWSDDGLDTLLDGRPVLHADSVAAPTAALRLHPWDGALRLDKLEVRAEDGAGATDALSESFDALASPSWASRALGWVSLILAVPLLTAAWLWAFERRAALSLRLVARALAPLALLLLASLPSRSHAGLLVCVAAAACGLIWAPVGLSVRGETGRRQAVLVALALMIFVGVGAAGALARWQALRPALAGERIAIARPAPAPVELTQPVRLDVGSALRWPGPWRDLELRAELELEPGSVAELRLRASPPPTCRGAALWLPARGDQPVGFVAEDALRFEPLGTTTGPAGERRAGELHVSLRGRHLHAQAFGQSFDAEVDADALPEGAIVLLAARGELTCRALSLRSAEAVDADSGAARELLAAALAQALLVLPLAGWLLLICRADVTLALVAAAFAALPLGAGWWLANGPLTLTELGTLAACSALLLLPALLSLPARRRGTILGGAPARVSALLLVLPLTPLAALAGAGQGLRPPPFNSPIAAYLAPGLCKVPPELLSLQHPMQRHLRDWLVDHRFRQRAHAPQAPAGTARVLALGGSQTWGYGLPEGAGLEWPAVLERLLVAERSTAGVGGAAEVINAAWSGATGARLLAALRDDLGAFHPDVVVLSLYYNDSFALTRLDEPEWLPLPSLPAEQRQPCDDLLRALALLRLENAFKDFSAEHSASAAPTLELWRAHAEPGEAGPPERFAAVLRGFAELARERGFDLVLMKEPTLPGRRLLWRAEFDAVMDRIGAEYGLAVIDPAPALAKGAGTSAFQDQVHLSPAGHAIVAAELLEAVGKRLPR